MAYLIAFILASYVSPVVVYQDADTGMGKCKMDQHYHNSDQLCHRDSDDSPVRVIHIGS